MTTRRPWRLLVSIFLASLLLPGLLLFSSLGLRLALGVAQALAPGCGFQFATMEGSLADGAVLFEVRLTTRDYTLVINRLALRLDTSALLRGEIHFPVIAAGEASLVLRATASAPSVRLPDLPRLPFALRVADATLASLALASPAAPDLRFKRLRAAFNWPRGAALQLVDFSLNQGATDVTLAGRWGHGSREQLDFEAHWQHRFPDGLLAQGSGRIKGAGGGVTFEQQLAAPLQASLTASVALPFEAGAWAITLGVPVREALPTVGLPAPMLVAGELRAQGRGLQLGAASIAASFQHGRLGAWQVDGRATGGKAGEILLDELVLSSVANRQIRLSGALDTALPGATLDGHWLGLQWPLDSAARVASQHGEFHLAGTPEDFIFRLDAETTVPSPPASALGPLQRWQARGRGNRHRIDLESLELAAGGGHASFSGVLDLAPALAVAIEGHWQDLAQALPRGQRVVSRRGELTVKGTPEAWAATSRFELALDKRPRGHIDLAATGGLASMKLDRFEARAGAGRMTAGGEIDWSASAPRWRLESSARDFDPGIWLPGWPGKLGFSLTTAGEPGDFTLVLDQLAGTLRGRRLWGGARLVRHGEALRVPGLSLHSGLASVEASGGVGQGQTLTWRVRVPALDDLMPGAAGTLSAEGAWTGTFEQPASHGQLAVQGLVLQDLALASATGYWDINPTRQQDQRLKLDTTGLRWQGRSLDTLAVALDGRLAAQAITVQAARGSAHFDLAAHGALATAPLRWAGALTAGSWRQGELAGFTLQAPSALAFTVNSFALSRQCWQGQGRLCLEAALQPAGDWQARASLEALALAALPPWVAWQRGEVSGALEARGSGQLLAALDGQFDVAPMRFEVADSTGPPIDFAGAHLAVATRPDGLTLDLTAALEQPGKVPLSLSLALPPGPWDLAHAPTLPLKGRFKLDAPDLASLAAYSDEVAELAGRAHADLGLGGSLRAPVLAGDARVEVSKMQITRLGIELDDLSLRLKGGSSGALALEGEARSGGGTASLRGKLEAGNAGLSASLRVDSTRFRVMDLPDASVLASARLVLDLHPSRATVTGEVDIPEAKLSLREGSPATERSADVRLVDEEAAGEARRFALESKVILRLGEKVNLEAKGLAGRLVGELKILDKDRQSTRATGALRIEDGHYTQWGQDLNLRRSRVVYSGQVLADPAVDARAERVVDTVTAGLHVTGRLQDPRVRLYSSPALPDADVLSYLVAGRPLSGTSSTDANALMGAAASLGLSQGGFLTQRIARTFGLDEIKVVNSPYAKDRRSVALNLGKFLSPRLYVGYGMGLLDQASTFRLRYLLDKHWNVEAETGSRSGADLLYSIER